MPKLFEAYLRPPRSTWRLAPWFLLATLTNHAVMSGGPFVAQEISIGAVKVQQAAPFLGLRSGQIRDWRATQGDAWDDGLLDVDPGPRRLRHPTITRLPATRTVAMLPKPNLEVERDPVAPAQLPSNQDELDGPLELKSADGLRGTLGHVASQNIAPPPLTEQRLQRMTSDANNRALPREKRQQAAPDKIDKNKRAAADDGVPTAQQAEPRLPLNEAVVDRATDTEPKVPADANVVHQPRSVPSDTTAKVGQPDPSILPIGVAPSTPTAAEPPPSPRVRPSIVQQAQGHINEGIRLARHGAVYSSRAQFIKVVRLVSQALDVETGSNRHAKALANGVTALDEAAQFRPKGSRVEADLDVARLVRTHRTPVFRDQSVENLTPLAAIQAYHAYAEKQLAIAGGHELVAADAYYGLAKLQGHLDLGASSDLRTGPVTMTYYQAALVVYPQHFLAANELGVLFARFGQMEDARDVLRFGAAQAPACPDLWLNLARVHERLGEDQMAESAMQEFQRIKQLTTRPAAPHGNRPNVEWMDPQAFAQKHPAPQRPRAAESRATQDSSWPFQ